MMPAQTKSHKYLPHVRIVNRAQGLYSVQSEAYGPHLLYLVDAVHGTCECPAGQHGRLCKHLKAVALLERACPRMPAVAAAAPVNKAAALAECFA